MYDTNIYRLSNPLKLLKMNRNNTTLDPAEWNGANNRCKEPFCGVELDMNDYDDICINCHNQVEPEEKEETQNK